MNVLYLTILAGLGMLYFIHQSQTKEEGQVQKGEISEGDFAQEAPPIMQDIEYIKKYIPDFQ